MKKTYLIIGVVLVGVAFYAGMKFGGAQGGAGKISAADIQKLSLDEQQQLFQSLRSAGIFGGRGGRNGGGFGGGQNGNDFTSGEVLSKDSQSITIKLRDGSSKIVFFSSSTSITKPASGTEDDLKTGTQVMVGGAANSDGSMTAQTIQVRPSQNRQ